MKRLSLINFFIINVFFLHAGDGDYAISRIPAGLLLNANVVKRLEIKTFEITNDGKAKFYEKIAYTVLNENGDRWGYFGEGYDKLRSIESFEGTLYDASGKKIKSLKKGDIKDVTGNDGESLADDNRAKWHSFYYK